MRYRINSAWPAPLGMVAAGTIIDDALQPNFKGVIPPPNVTPLDQETRDWLVRAYVLHQLPNPIEPVETASK